ARRKSICVEIAVSMTTLTITITNSDGQITGEYKMVCEDRPGIDAESFDSRYTIDLIRSHAERDRYVSDFAQPTLSSKTSVHFSDPISARRRINVNELWFEIDNLFPGARLNFATARMLKYLEDLHPSDDSALNERRNLHLEKMERFNLAVFELARVEDLVARLVYEYFGDGFIEGVDESKEGWEKRITWDRMKEALNRRGKPDAHPKLEVMDESEYRCLMTAIRSYRSRDLLALISYRDRRTHQPAPTVDYPELGVS